MIQKFYRYKWLVLGLCFLVNAINICWLMGVMTAVLPSLVIDLDITPVQAGLLMTASTIPGFFAAFLGGMVGDRFGPKWVVGLMAVLAGLSSVFRGLFPTFLGVFIGAFLIRMAQGFEWPGLVKTLAHWVNERNRGLAFGILISGCTMSSALVTLLTPLYVMPLLGGWAPAFIYYGMIATIIGIMWLILVKNPEIESTPNNPSETISMNKTLKSLIREKDLFYLSGIRFVGFLTQIAFTSFLPLTLIIQGFPAETAYWIASIQPWSSTIGTFTGPFLSDRVGLRKIFIYPRGIINLIGFLIIGTSNSIPLILMGVILSGFINGMTMPIMTAIPLEHPAIGPALAGTVTGFLITIGSLGGTIGQLSYTWILETFGAREALITMGLLCSIITLFTIPLSETGVKGRKR